MKKLLLLLTSLYLSGCNYNLSKVPLSFQEGLSDIPEGTILSYQTLNSKIIGPRCLECHSNSGGNSGDVNLESYEKVMGQLGDIKDSVESNRMPKNRAKLSARELNLLVTWINAGGPRDGVTVQTPPVEPTPTPTPVPTPTPTEPPTVVLISYQKVYQEVLRPRCISCHSAEGNNRGGINLETYENVFAAAAKIDNSIKTGSMPRPKNKPLTTEQKDLILKWIADGAQFEPTPVVVVSYEKVFQEVLRPRCINCHSNAGGNRGGVNLETFENVSAAAAKIEETIKSGSMPRPKTKPLTPEQKDLILKWIAEGAQLKDE